MTDLVTELAERGKSLSAEDRARLVDLLLVSLQEPATAEAEAAWKREIDRRFDAYDRGQVEAILAEDVFAKTRKTAS